MDQQKSLIRVKRRAPFGLTYRTKAHTQRSLAEVLRRRQEERGRDESNLLPKERDFWVQEDEDVVDRSRVGARISMRLPGSFVRPYRGGYGGKRMSFGKRGYLRDVGDLDSQPDWAMGSEEGGAWIQTMNGLDDLAGTGLDFNDPRFKDQWYLVGGLVPPLLYIFDHALYTVITKRFSLTNAPQDN